MISGSHLPAWIDKELHLHERLSKHNVVKYSLFSNDYQIVTNSGLIIKCRKNSSDGEVFEQVFDRCEYAPLVEYLRNVNVRYVIDAGANIGCATLFLKQYFPSAQFICIEPSRDNYTCCKVNCANNHLAVNIENAALWGESKKLKLSKDFRDGKEWSYCMKESPSGTIHGINPDEIFRKYNIDVLDVFKIDIEGGEKDLFLAANLDLSWLNKVRSIFIEIHDDVVDRDLLIRVMSDYNFKYYDLGELSLFLNQQFL